MNTFILRRTYQPSFPGSDDIHELLYCHLKQGHWWFFHQCWKCAAFLLTGEKQIIYLTAYVVENPTIQELWLFFWDFKEMRGVKYFYMTELVLVIQLSLTKKAEINPRNFTIKRVISIYWVTGSELLKWSYTPIRHMAQNINGFGCQNLCFYQSDLPSNSVPAGCVHAGIIGSKETKDWKMQLFFQVL